MPTNSITVVVARRPVEGKEREMEAYTEEVKKTLSDFPGHLESTVCKPETTNDPEYRIVIKFDSLENYRLWEQSEKREKLTKMGNAITDEPPQLKIMTGLETWFSLPGGKQIQPPKKYKMVVITYFTLFPLIELFTWLLGPHIGHMPQIARTLIATALIVPVMTYIAMPAVTKALSKWLYPDLEER